jgi:hypothetical protein
LSVIKIFCRPQLLKCIEKKQDLIKALNFVKSEIIKFRKEGLLTLPGSFITAAGITASLLITDLVLRTREYALTSLTTARICNSV